ncbi:MAG: SDR family NAD(P)-dependent oxidoreductase [Planctomycetota bacterium]
MFRSRWNPRGRLAVVTGASSGIGRDVTRILLSKGCSVIATARRTSRLAELEQLPRRDNKTTLHTISGDVTDTELRVDLVKLASKIGRLDLLVNNAGVGAIGSFADANAERLQFIVDVNFIAPAELTRLAIPLLKQSDDAVICNIGSVLGHRAGPDKSEYCASKFALHGWSDSLRAELSPFGIGVTLVSPSTTKSEFFDVLVQSDPEAKSKSVGSWPVSRVAEAVVHAIEKRRDEAILSLGGKLLVYADRICPPLMNRILRSRSND